MAKLFQHILLLFLVVFILSAAAQTQSKRCPANQVWKSCGTACPSKCGMPAPKVCTYQCVIGCQCKKGYWLKSNGECVLRKNC